MWQEPLLCYFQSAEGMDEQKERTDVHKQMMKKGQEGIVRICKRGGNDDGGNERDEHPGT